MQFGGTTKYVATKFAVGSGSGQKLAMLRKLPEVSCSDLRPLEPWCHGVSHGVRVGIVVSCLGMALKHIQGRYPNPNNDNPHSYIPYYPQFSSWPLEGGRRIRRMAAGVRQRLTRVCLVCLMNRPAPPPHHPLNLPTLHGPHAHPHLH